MMDCVSCGRHITPSYALITGDGPVCGECFTVIQARDRRRQDLIEAGVSATSLEEAAHLRKRFCPKCRKYSMKAAEVTHHVTRFRTSSGRTEYYTCRRCGHSAELASDGRFMVTTIITLGLGVLLLAGVLAAVPQFMGWAFLCGLLAVGVILAGVRGIVTRLRHPPKPR